MNYDFTQEMLYGYHRFLKSHFIYYNNDRKAVMVNHNNDDVIPDYFNSLSFNGANDKHLKFLLDDSGLNALRYRISSNLYSNYLYEEEISSAIINIRLNFLKFLLSDIKIRPGSFKIKDLNSDNPVLIFYGKNNEEIMIKGDLSYDSFNVDVCSEKKNMCLSVTPSVLTARHFRESYPDIYEDQINSMVDCSGRIITDNGFYIFSKDKLPIDDHFIEYCFSVAFYDIETLNWLLSEESNNLKNIAEIRRALNGGNAEYLKKCLSESGIMPDFEFSIERPTTIDIINYSKEIFNDPETFINKYYYKKTNIQTNLNSK